MLQRHQITTHTNWSEETWLNLWRHTEVEWLYITKATSISRFEKGEMVYSGGAPYTRLAVWQKQHLRGHLWLLGRSIITWQVKKPFKLRRPYLIWDKEPVRKQYQSHKFLTKLNIQRQLALSWFGGVDSVNCIPLFPYSLLYYKNWVDLALSWFEGVDSVGVDLVGVDLKAPNRSGNHLVLFISLRKLEGVSVYMHSSIIIVCIRHLGLYSS